MLDLGVLVGRVLFDDAEFQTGYARVLRQMGELGRAGTAAATGTGKLDASLTQLGRSSTAAATAEDKAAAAASRHAEAVARVGGIMDRVTVNAQRLQQAELRVVAAQERLDTLMASGTATTRQLASAQAGLVGAQRAVATAQEQTAGRVSTLTGSMDRQAASLARVEELMQRYAGESEQVRAAALREAAAQERLNVLRESGVASSQQLASAQASLITSQRALTTAQAEGAVASRSMLAGFGRTAVELGLLIGGIEIARKVIEFVGAGKELTDALNSVQAASRATDQEMEAVRAQALALGRDLTVPGATAVDAADAILELVKAGIALPRALEAARPALLLAAATNSKMADTAKVLGDTMDIFSIKGAGAAHAANIIGASVLGASHDLLGFFDAMKQAGPTAQALKVNIDDLSTVIVYLAKHGLSTSMGGAAIKTFMTNLTKDVPKAKDALHDLGVEAFDAEGRFVGFPRIFDQLHNAYIRFGPDSERFLKDLNAAFGVRSQSAASLFGKVTGAALDEVHARLETGDLQQFADTMNRGVAAGFRQLGKEATAAGIALYGKLEPALATAVSWLGDKLPGAVHTLADILGPTVHLIGTGFAGAWWLVVHVLGPVVDLLGQTGHFLADNNDVVKALATAVFLLWGAYKGYVVLKSVVTWLGLARVRYAQYVAELSYGTRIQQAQSAVLQVGAGRLVAFAMGVGLAALGTYELGKAFGWTGPVAVKMSSAVELLTSSTDDFRDALQASNGAVTESIRLSVAKQLQDSGAAAEAAKSGISLRTLTDAVFGNTDATVAQMKAWAASGKISDKTWDTVVLLNLAYHDGAKRAVELATATDKAAAATRTGADATVKLTDKQAGLARLLGIVVDKNGETSASQSRVNDAVRVAATVYDQASVSVRALIDADSAFATSQGSALDRATLIAATLKAANGDALAYAGSIATTTSAIDSLIDAFKQEQQQLAQQSQSQASAAERVSVAQMRLNEMRRKGKSSAAELASAEKSLHDAQAAAGKSGAIAYEDTMRAALRFRQTNEGLVASIDTGAKGAADLVQQLQGIQDAAVAAASAEYQHEVAQKGAKRAADEAYQLYVSKTRGSLIDNAKQLGLTVEQARALARQYFGLDGKRVKTLIESEGTDKIVNVLTRIGKLLAHIAKVPWRIKVHYETTGEQPTSTVADRSFLIPVAPPQGPTRHRAAGGPVTAGATYEVNETGRSETYSAGGRQFLIPGVDGRVIPAPIGNGGQQKQINIGHFTFAPVINYPDKERATEALPRQLRGMGEQLESFL